MNWNELKSLFLVLLHMIQVWVDLSLSLSINSSFQWFKMPALLFEIILFDDLFASNQIKF